MAGTRGSRTTLSAWIRITTTAALETCPLRFDLFVLGSVEQSWSFITALAMVAVSLLPARGATASAYAMAQNSAYRTALTS